MENNNLLNNDNSELNGAIGPISNIGNPEDQTSGSTALDRGTEAAPVHIGDKKTQEASIDYEALAIVMHVMEEKKENDVTIKSITKHEDITLSQGLMKYPYATNTVFVVTETERVEDEQFETLELYKSFYDRTSKEFRPVKIAIISKRGELELTSEYKQLLESYYRQDFAEMMQRISIDQLKLCLLDPNKMISLIDNNELTTEIDFLKEIEDIGKKYQLQMLEGQKQQEDILKLDGNLPELESPEGYELPNPDKSDDLEKIAQRQGITSADIKSSTKIDPKELIATGITFESALGITGKYETVYATAMNGTYALYGINSKTKQPELIMEHSGTTQSERDVPLMNETGTSIVKRQTRAIFKVDAAQALALNIEPGGKMNVYYCARGNDEHEYFGIPIGTDKQAKATGKVERFMGIEVAGNRANRYNTIDEAYEQLRETSETNQTLVDSDKNNDVIYYNVDEKIKMHDGSITSITEEAEHTPGFQENLSGYLQELEKADGSCLSDKITDMRARYGYVDNDVDNDIDKEHEHSGHDEREQVLSQEEQAALREEMRRFYNSNQQ